jgi:hypothetical protein
MAVVYVMKQKNTAPQIQATLTLPEGATLEGAKEVLMHMRPKSGGEVFTDIVMTIVSKPENKIKHRWESAEVQLGIVYQFEFEVIFEEESRNLGVPNSGFYELEFTERIKK